MSIWNEVQICYCLILPIMMLFACGLEVSLIYVHGTGWFICEVGVLGYAMFLLCLCKWGSCEY